MESAASSVQKTMKGIHPKLLEFLEQLGSERSLTSGEMLFNQGEEGRALYLVRSGSLNMFMEPESETEEPLGTARAGEFLGELEFLEGGSRLHSARALEDTRVLEIGVDVLEKGTVEQPLMGVELLSTVGSVLLGRLDRMNDVHRKEMLKGIELSGAQSCDFRSLFRETFQVEVSLTEEEERVFTGSVISISGCQDGDVVTLLDEEGALIFIPFHSIATIKTQYGM